MRETEHPRNPARSLRTASRSARVAAAGCLACVALLAIAATSGCGSGGAGAGSSDTSPTVGAHMAGPVADVNVTPEAMASKPTSRILATPQGAVQSYLDWISYAYRIGQSQVATATMTTYEEVRVDSYIQYNIQKSRLIDQTLQSITFGKLSVGSTSTIVPAKEKWTYRYVSIETAGKTIGGPYSADYDATYVVVKSKTGDWVVDSVKVKASGEVK